MPTDKKEVIWDYITRIHGPIDRDTFDAIYGTAIAHHLWGEYLTSGMIHDIVLKHRPKVPANGRPSSAVYR